MSTEDANVTSDPEAQGVFEYLISGPASARLLDFFVTYKDFDYSETDIGELAEVSNKTVIKELVKFESLGLIKFTRHVGRAKMFRLNPNSRSARALQELAFALAENNIENMDPLQKRITESEKEEILNQNN